MHLLISRKNVFAGRRLNEDTAANTGQRRGPR